MQKRNNLAEEISTDRVGATREARRDFLRRLGGLLGVSALATLSPGLPVALAYVPRSDTLTRDGELLNLRQLSALHDLCDHTLPATDTPGAAELDVHGFIDAQLSSCHSTEEQQRVRAVLDALNGTGEGAFHDLYKSRQLELLERMERSGDASQSVTREDFKFLKNLVVFGYFTTEVGASRLLRFDPYPGGFDGKARFPADNRAWFA